MTQCRPRLSRGVTQGPGGGHTAGNEGSVHGLPWVFHARGSSCADTGVLGPLLRAVPSCEPLLLGAGVWVRETTRRLPASLWHTGIHCRTDYQSVCRKRRGGAGFQGCDSRRDSIAPAQRPHGRGHSSGVCSRFLICDLTGWKAFRPLSATSRQAVLGTRRSLGVGVGGRWGPRLCLFSLHALIFRPVGAVCALLLAYTGWTGGTPALTSSAPRAARTARSGCRRGRERRAVLEHRCTGKK